MQCYAWLDPEITFTGIEFKQLVEEEPFVPKYPDMLSFSLIYDPDYTQELDLEEFKNSQKAKSLEERITDDRTRGNWKDRLRGYYQITSGKSFNMQIDLLFEEDETIKIFDDSSTTAALTFYQDLTAPASLIEELGDSEDYKENLSLKSSITQCKNGIYEFQNVEI